MAIESRYDGAGATLTGVVEDCRELTSAEPRSTDGLCLRTDDGQTVRLIGGAMNAQMSNEAAWQVSRYEFEPYLGKRITVEGYLSHDDFWDARVKSEH